MRQLFNFLILSLFVPSLCQNAQWINELLTGVNSVKQHGTPGGIHTWFKKTSAIITAPNKPNQVIMAAAELGRGRIIIFAQDGYSRDFQYNRGNARLNSNMRRWLTRGRSDNSRDVQGLPSTGSLSTSKIYVLNAKVVSLQRAREVLSFVRDQGGAFVQGITPWAYEPYVGKKPIVEDEMYELYSQAGLSWDPSVYVGGINGMFPISQSQGRNVLSIESALEQLSGNPSSIIEKHGRYIAAGFQLAPTSLVNGMVGENTLKPLLDIVRQNLPSDRNKIRSNLGRGAVALTGAILSNDAMATKNVKAPGYELFPGRVTSTTRRTVTFEFTSRNGNEWHSTGHYVAAGEAVTINVISGNVKNWLVRIGAHSDNLSSKNEYRRYPVVDKVRALKNGMKIHTPFGGLFYLVNRPANAGTVKIRVTGLVEAPYYDLRATSHSKWLSSRNAPAPWAEFVTNGISFVLPSESIRNLYNPQEIMQLYNKAAKGQHHLRGTNWMTHRFERIVTDEQPSAGYMHSGYPIVTHLDVARTSHKHFLMNAANLKRYGSWGIFHELGHNRQRGEWTFQGTGEVTCNIFTLNSHASIGGWSPFKDSWLRGQHNKMSQYLRNPSMSAWQKDAGVALGIYAQFAENFGWEAYKQFFRRYESGSVKPRNEQEKIDSWLTVMSSVVGKDLSPMFQFWGISVSSNARTAASRSGRAFLPDDELSRLSSSRVSTILRSYPSAERQTNKMADRTTDPNANKSLNPTMKIISSTYAPSARGYYYQESDAHLEGIDRRFSVDTEELKTPGSCGARV